MGHGYEGEKESEMGDGMKDRKCKEGGAYGRKREKFYGWHKEKKKEIEDRIGAAEKRWGQGRKRGDKRVKSVNCRGKLEKARRSPGGQSDASYDQGPIIFSAAY